MPAGPAQKNLEREIVLQEADEHKKRGIPKRRVDQASEKIKRDFHKLFGVKYDEVKENIDTR